MEYVPTAPGDYDVNITYGNENIPGSPFVVSVKDVVDPNKVRFHGLKASWVDKALLELV